MAYLASFIQLLTRGGQVPELITVELDPIKRCIPKEEKWTLGSQNKIPLPLLLESLISLGF